MSCPNQNTAEWKALESAVGNFEAYRDYLETDGLIRTPEEVLAKIEERDAKLVSLFEHNPDTLNLVTDIYPEEPTAGIDTKQVSNALAIELLNKMSNAIGSEFETVTENQAIELTKDSLNPWSSEAGFYYGGKTYFLQDRVNANLVFHEFSHPVVRSISIENPTLFNNLYTELASTTEGAIIIESVKQSHGELADLSDRFKEECIVKALEKDGIELLSKSQPQSAFGAFIKNLLYNIRQFMRRSFGKTISISKLDANTKLHELAEILSTGDKIKIETQLITDEDLVAYNREAREDVMKDLLSIRQQDTQDTVNTFYDLISEHIKTLLNDENYSELSELLLDKAMRGDLQSMKANLKSWQDTVKTAAENFTEDVDNVKKLSLIHI